jgi:hypothetical protein
MSLEVNERFDPRPDRFDRYPRFPRIIRGWRPIVVGMRTSEIFLGPLLAVKSNGIKRDALGGEVIVRSQKIAFRLAHPGLMRFIRYRFPCPRRWRWPEKTRVCERLQLSWQLKGYTIMVCRLMYP